MAQMPVLQEFTPPPGPSRRGQPILQIKELEPDWGRYNAWRASLIESYSAWFKRWRRWRFPDPGS